MKSYYVNFIYLRPSKEVKLGFSTINKYFKFAATLYYSCVSKEGVCWENYCRYMSIHSEEEFREEILYGLRRMTAVTGEVSDLQSIPIGLFPS